MSNVDDEELKHIKPFEHKDAKVSTGTQTVKLRWDTFGWATIFFDNDSGALSIQSDYGDWSYMWNARGSRSLAVFFVEVSPAYIAEKFYYGKESYEYDVEGTVESIKQKILTARRDDAISKEEALELWEEWDCLDWDCLPDGLGFQVNRSTKLWEFLGEGTEQFMEGVPKFQYMVLRSRVIPFLQNECKKLINAGALK